MTLTVMMVPRCRGWEDDIAGEWPDDTGLFWSAVRRVVAGSCAQTVFSELRECTQAGPGVKEASTPIFLSS